MKPDLKYTMGIALWLAAASALWAQDDGQFSLVKEDGPIKIHERWITFPGSDPPLKAREVKGEFTVDAPIGKALDLLKDEGKIMEWQKHVSEFRVYPLPVDTAWLEYSYHDIPWPVSDQDHFLVYRVVKKEEGRVFIIFSSTANDQLCSVREGVDRMNLLGSWCFRKLGNGKTMATYRIISQPSTIPRIFTDPVIRRNLMSTIKAYIKILEGNG